MRRPPLSLAVDSGRSRRPAPEHYPVWTVHHGRDRWKELSYVTAPIGVILGVVALLILLPVVAAVLYRLVFIRRNSTSLLSKRASEDAWRYGAVRYTDTEVEFYRLLSIRFRPDARLDRRTLELGKRRQPTGTELDIAEEGEIIVPFSGQDRSGRVVDGELCLGPAELTAMLSWVEACSIEQVRPRRHRR